ncbi:MAG: FAD-binding oxidoreductase [Cyclobacteriaceae bacterium]|nr:FAD-binding oxidoreductase [Cyclobacteriaceae bacterium HetDA_MAG_MS6]
MTRKVDLLIVGQGIAGSLLSYTLHKNGFTVKVIDKPVAHTSSMVAAGLYNPITGRKMVTTWMGKAIFSGLEEFYSDLQQDLGVQVLFPKSIYRPFVNVEEQNDWSGKASHMDEAKYFIEEVRLKPLGVPKVLDKYGGLMLKRSGYVDLPLMVESIRNFLAEQGIYQSELFQYDELKVNGDSVVYKDIHADKVIFCEGTLVKNNPYWKHLRFRPVKGEIMSIEADLDTNFILNRGVFVIPKANGFTVGSTYDHNDLSNLPTEKGVNTITAKLKKIYSGNYNIITTRAGIRPATFDRRPFIGWHEKMPNVGIFNGLGAKGVSLAPYFVSKIIENLKNGKQFIKEVDVSR